ncbi:MAG TPA: hypothetical protein VN238_22535 [Solirubrobacteraceae bacterium]|nr:hypothetical protein [Solirubrobacteraceae bacterium]
MLRPALLVAGAAAGLVLAAAAPASASPATPLVDRAPAPGATFTDTVVRQPSLALKARASQATDAAVEYRTPSGDSVGVQLAPVYGNDPAVAQSYVDFVDSLPHGAELGELTMRIVPSADVPANCGATQDSGVLACYLPTQDLMIVPGDELQNAGGVTTSYVVAHEYGHHVANHRSNSPFNALDFGPKQWASEQDVCSYTLDGRLAPGDEAEAYAANPGEAWAESYAQLKYPTGRVELHEPAQADDALAGRGAEGRRHAVDAVAQALVHRAADGHADEPHAHAQAAARRQARVPPHRPARGGLRPRRHLQRRAAGDDEGARLARRALLPRGLRHQAGGRQDHRQAPLGQRQLPPGRHVRGLTARRTGHARARRCATMWPWPPRGASASSTPASSRTRSASAWWPRSSTVRGRSRS